MIISVILLDSTQKSYVSSFNDGNPANIKAIICNYGSGDCISSDVLTLEGFEDLATYFSGATLTDIEVTEPI